jgi:hypothetical protein
MPETCHVCGQAADDTDSAICLECDRRFHLRLVADSDGPECGEVWINEQFLSMEFACNRCLGARCAADSAEPPVGKGH